MQSGLNYTTIVEALPLDVRVTRADVDPPVRFRIARAPPVVSAAPRVARPAFHQRHRPAPLGRVPLAGVCRAAAGVRQPQGGRRRVARPAGLRRVPLRHG